MIATTTVEKMAVTIYESNEALGKAAARDFATIMQRAVDEKGEVAAILATGNSQLSFVTALREQTDIPWDRITVFHMDEYLGMPDTHPASFRRFLIDRIVTPFQPKAMVGVNGDAPDTEAELQRYTDLLNEHQPVVCVLGIGENGHLAFNDPPADFETDKLIHVVDLDIVCRSQQVGEGHFATIDDVPAQAMSLTVPALLKPDHVMALVPEARKAQAVKASLEGPVTPMVPGSILRTQSHVKLYLDPDSASLLRLPALSEAQ